LHVQQFQRYLPTAFDEGFTLLQKVDKLIVSMNRVGKLSNDVLDQWNQVMDWVMADGLDASINSKIDSMLQDGSLATIIGTALTDLGTQLTALSSTVTANQTTLEAEISTNKTTLEAEIATNTTAITNLSNKVTKMKFYGTPEEYGAVGDGVTDDTTAVQQALTNCMITAFNPNKYLVKTTLVLPKFHSIQGNHAQIVVPTSGWIPSSLGASVPVNTILYVQGHDNYVNEDVDINTPFVRDLRIIGNYNYNFIGMYLGTPNQNAITSNSTNANAVIGVNFENISISLTYDALLIAEAWQCSFKNIQVGSAKNRACAIVGQSVNNTFMGCVFRTANQGIYGVYIDGATYNGTKWRPEGNMFIGGMVGEGQNGVRVVDGFAIKFTSVIIDLNSSTGIIIDPVSEDVIFSDCYIASNGGTCVSIIDNTDPNQVGRLTIYRGCNFIPAGTNTTSATVGSNQQAIFDGCQFTKNVTFASTAMGSVINSLWNQVMTGDALINTSASGLVFTQNNYFKLQHTAVVVN
jgi:hypothetical protein